MNRQDLEALVHILNRAAVSPAERLWLLTLIEKLEKAMPREPQQENGGIGMEREITG